MRLSGQILTSVLTAMMLLPVCGGFVDVTGQLFDGKVSPGGNVAWADLDDDSWVDLIVNGRIYRNCGGQKFVDVTPANVRVNGPALAVDFNGDGKLDLFFAGSYQYFTGDGNFNFAPAELPLVGEQVSLGACAADLDGDGWVDIYFTGYEIWEKNQSFPDYILRNDHGRFEIVWKSPPGQTMRCRGGVTACDFNEDGKPEIYVANYRLQPNFLWFFNGYIPDNRAREYGVAGSERPNVKFKTDLGVEYPSSGHTISAVWGDFDNDGLFDLFAGNFSHPPDYQDRPQFLKNSGKAGDYRFTDRSRDAKLRWQESYAGAAAADYDNDGRLDLFFGTIYKGDKGVLLHNDGDWHFSEDTGNIEAATSFQCAWGDYNHDGKPDLFAAGRLYQNVTDAGDYLRVKLVGNAPLTSATGAKVILHEGDRVQIRQVESATGCSAQNESVLHFGLGKNSGPLTLQIRWPDGRTETRPAVKNTLLLITQ